MKPSLFFVVVPSTALSIIACSGTAAEQADHAARDEAPLVSDATSMLRRADGRWDVTCRDGRHEIVTSEQITANDVCNAEPVSCVPRCKERWQNGQCKTWDADYCAPSATCRAHVVERWQNGNPKSYGPDFCTTGESMCAVRCIARWQNGQCNDFGSDVCAKGAVACVPHVIERFQNGNPQTYGPDFCKEGPQAPRCIAKCVRRYPNGTCAEYGADICN